MEIFFLQVKFKNLNWILSVEQKMTNFFTSYITYETHKKLSKNSK